jgi:hypothetical protein
MPGDADDVETAESSWWDFVESIQGMFADTDFAKLISTGIDENRRSELEQHEAEATEELDQITKLAIERRVFNKLAEQLTQHLAARFKYLPPITAGEIIEALFHQLAGYEANGIEWIERYQRSGNLAVLSVVPLGLFPGRSRREAFVASRAVKGPWRLGRIL